MNINVRNAIHGLNLLDVAAKPINISSANPAIAIRPRGCYLPFSHPALRLSQTVISLNLVVQAAPVVIVHPADKE